MSDKSDDEFGALQRVIAALSPLDPEVRGRIIASASTFLQVDAPMPGASVVGHPASSSEAPRPAYPSFSEDHPVSPKAFLFEKQPRTDVERVAVLAYYLTHYRDMPHFKTLDLSKLNTEAAQPKFSNAADSASNAVKRHYLVPSQKGQRQLSAAGERFVMALPDHDAARAAMKSAMPRRVAKRPTAKKSSPPNS